MGFRFTEARYAHKRSRCARFRTTPFVRRAQVGRNVVKRLEAVRCKTRADEEHAVGTDCAPPLKNVLGIRLQPLRRVTERRLIPDRPAFPVEPEFVDDSERACADFALVGIPRF